ncbi:rRNA (guanine-N1-)-methyltransferase [Alcanivorax hongdengensis A-11-3]|uniref:rRNA (Guanine-N1-)-methyltransferase n=1 Tax=Alcanivorax hongdengensis A-11-3 TaxID=1177179 RepID=L0W874_9GAMM|nr:methyltransferase domain-containing protein [Alcanivorax hongdengensis]EKF72898.1 rRNA (guanine-N1-)-methyltransferase [Alcanivorax hongdengensis A-11-3]
MPTLKCPSCDLPLIRRDHGWYCDNGHQFDRAKRGYTNLLLAQHRRSRSPGDDKAMVQARSAFLALGRYQPLADALLAGLEDEEPAWLDIGCGEGWYTEQIARRLGAVNGIGVDISKFAVDAAARRNRRLTWLVASGARLPLFDASQQKVFVLFTRLFVDDIARVLQPGGELVVAGTGEQHLMPLREALYDDVRQRRFDAGQFLDARFEAISTQEIHCQWQPESVEELRNLLAMTPHHWRAKPSAKAGIDRLFGQPMNAHFVLQRWRRFSDAETVAPDSPADGPHH